MNDNTPASNANTILPSPVMIVAPSRLKLLVVGDCQVGKTSIIKKYCEDRFFNKSNPTIGIDFGVKTLLVNNNMNSSMIDNATTNSVNNNNSKIQLNIYDTSGHIDYLEIRNEFYKECHVVSIDYICIYL